MLARWNVTIAVLLVLGALALSVSWPAWRDAPAPQSAALDVAPLGAAPFAGAAAGEMRRSSVATAGLFRHGEPRTLAVTRQGRRALDRAGTRWVFGAAARDDSAPEFRDHDALSNPPGAPVAWPPEAAAQLQQRARERTAQGGKRASTLRTAPWTADQLLANPTDMNDESVSLAANPATGHLFAVFAAYDLGGTDRDIYIARSLDEGQTWTTIKMPTFSLDESMPDLAIDAAGYIYVVWVRADGCLIRARSAGPEEIHSWAYTQAFEVGQPVAVPTIAVSGSGDFARVFIACSWYTINWSWYQYEYTLLWLYSTNGGQTVAYNYLEPDGYPDLWPVAAMHGAMVYLVNGEQDPSTGRIRILAAADALSGTFVDYVDLCQTSPMSHGFPTIAADGLGVYMAYQLDWDDGLGNIDGDIMYAFSWDGLATVYGPYAMQATLSESLGPALYTRGGVVGCLWLEAPPGDDEFHLAARQAPGDGHPDYWGELEQVTALPMVVPLYRSAAGAVAGVHDGGVTTGPLVAAWIDRRDYVSAGYNVYTSRRALLPNLAPFVPAGWQSPLVVSMIPGQREDGSLAAGYPAYASLAVANLGLAAAPGPVAVELRCSGELLGAWTVPGGLPAGSYATAEDQPLSLAAGTQTLTLRLDPLGVIPESDESDNELNKVVWVGSGDPRLVLVPARLDLVADAPAPAPPARPQPARGPVVDPRLQDVLAGAGPGDRLRVVVTPRARPEPQDLARRSRGAALAALREHAAQFAARVNDKDALPLRSLWLSGELAGELTPQAIAELAVDPAVGRIWLDDQLSRSFTAPAAPNPVPAPPPRALPLVLETVPAAPGSRGPATTELWHLEMLGAPAVWQQGLDGSGVLIGHTDSGVAWDHPGLAGRLWDGGPEFPHHGYDFLDQDFDPYDPGSGGFWHGTHTAGLLVGVSSGVAPGARVLVARCVPGYYQDLVAALQFCLDHGCHLISTSAGWTQPDDALRSANRTNAEIMLALGVPWVTAAGNGDNQGGHVAVPYDISSPADSPEPAYGAGGRSAVIAVGAVSQASQIWSSSSYGPTAWQVADNPAHSDYAYPPGLIKPDLVAPGVNITSTIGGGGYAAYSGTSMATPLVAGAAAILRQANPLLTPDDLAAVLAATCDDLGAAGRDNFYGAGLVNLPAAVAALPASSAALIRAHNAGAVPLLITGITPTVSWLQVSPAAAAVAPGDSLRVNVVWDAGGLPVGVHLGAIVFASNDPQGSVHLPVILVVGQSVDVAEQAPPRTGRLSNYPNPFNPSTTVRFELAKAAPVRLDLFDARGRLVKSLARGDRAAGRHEVAWDGRDAAGRACAAGVYLARLEAAGQITTARLLLVR